MDIRLMAALCRCGLKKNHAMHLLALGMEGAHKYADPTKAGISSIGRDREEYQKSEQHKAAYARADEQPLCLAGMANCPEPCGKGEAGLPTPHHVFAVSAAGNRQKAEEWPVITLCAHHNNWVEGAGRAWAERTTFERDGIEYPFRISAKMARAMTSPAARVSSRAPQTDK